VSLPDLFHGDSAWEGPPANRFHHPQEAGGTPAPRRQVATGHFTGDLTMAGPAGRIAGEGQRRRPQPQNAMVPLGLNAIGDWGELYVGAVVFVVGGAQDFAAVATMDVEW
jgi:hypothetical protein